MNKKVIRVSRPELLVQAPDNQTSVFGGAGYSRKSGMEMILRYSYQRVSDVSNEEFYRYSTDNGKTWSEPVKVYDRSRRGEIKPIKVPSGHFIGGQRNPYTGETILFSDKRVKPKDMHPDTPQHYWTQTALTYAISIDDGKTAGKYQPLVKMGKEFSPRHPFDGLYLGQNQIYGIHGILFLNPDTMLVPIELSVLDSDGKIYNPCSWDFSQAVVLIGRRKGKNFVWYSSRPVWLDAETQSTRGVNEPTMAEMADGSVLMVARGSNSDKPGLPSYKWRTISRDRGKTWSKLETWTFNDRRRFFSPSSISKLVKHSSGRVFWFGNICPENAKGNQPRYPLVVGEVDRKTGLIIRKTVTVIADKTSKMNKFIEFSNFQIYEDRLTDEFVLDMCHHHPTRSKNHPEWPYSGNLYRYRIIVE